MCTSVCTRLLGGRRGPCLPVSRAGSYSREPGHASDPTSDGALALAKQPLGPEAPAHPKAEMLGRPFPAPPGLQWAHGTFPLQGEC